MQQDFIYGNEKNIDQSYQITNYESRIIEKGEGVAKLPRK